MLDLLKWSLVTIALAKSNDPLLDLPKQRLNGVCNSYPFITCRGQISHGKFGAGARAIISVNHLPPLGYDLYVNCPIDTTRPGEYRPQCGPKHLVRDEHLVPTFMKTTVEKRVDHEHQTHSFFVKGWSAWHTELIGAQNLASTGYGPSIYYIVSRNTNELHPLHDHVFFQRDVGHWTVSAVFRRLTREVGDLLEGPPLPQELDNVFFEVVYRSKTIFRLLEATILLSQKFHSTGYSHCDFHPANIILISSHTQFLSSSKTQSLYKSSFNMNGWLLLSSDTSDPLVYKSIEKNPSLYKDKFFEVIHVTSAKMWIIDPAFSIKSEDSVAPCAMLSACRAEDLVELWKAVDKLELLEEVIASEIDKLNLHGNTSVYISWKSRLERLNILIRKLYTDIKDNEIWFNCKKRYEAIQEERRGLTPELKRNVCSKKRTHTCSLKDQDTGFKSAIKLIRKARLDLASFE
eukprot:Blabericola_migrator_1__1755@NODE_1474_length_4481_cov_83_008156_g969_i0_p1_GENE_NODE_1474_length_4481_cov_83_008156_g969_i0NODE_1474_length_4481_cov_83_008156_g969_i0_p1_ORF_typecomplete_len461_score85_37WaaY/PF06176_11/3_8e03WaaY/PF06176_11/0_035Kdo/PF06293_14/0_15Pkinase/PF00069_25/0_27Pkinase/PF00069_25/3_8e03_NODE_1474_length_4481_cov_83_008156_g969_i01431525